MMVLPMPDTLHSVERREFMKAGTAFLIAALWEVEPVFAQKESAQEKRMMDSKKSATLPVSLTYEDVRAVSPALEHYTKGSLLDGLWKRPELSPRDRSIVTVAALIARIQTIEMPFHFSLALDHGVKPGELSEIITHLAFYSGWANAMSAVAVAKDLFHRRGISADVLPPREGQAAAVERRSGEAKGNTGEHKLWGGLSWAGAEHDRSFVSGPLVAARARTS
jgi:4-carboxymuconolactone decarboxylase